MSFAGPRLVIGGSSAASVWRSHPGPARSGRRLRSPPDPRRGSRRRGNSSVRTSPCTSSMYRTPGRSTRSSSPSGRSTTSCQSIPSHSPVGALASLDLSAARAALDLKLFGNVNVARSAARHVVAGGSIAVDRSDLFAHRLLRHVAARRGERRRRVARQEPRVGACPDQGQCHQSGNRGHGLLGSPRAPGARSDAARCRERLPTGRVATADDIATIATALMTSRNITGAVVDVDGGMLLH